MKWLFSLPELTVVMITLGLLWVGCMTPQSDQDWATRCLGRHGDAFGKCITEWQTWHKENQHE